MNLLEDLFRNSNSALVLGVTKVFLNLTQSMPPVHEQVLGRLKNPLITLMASGSSESSYACLCHLKLLIQRSPTVFAQDYKHFYCRGNDPTYTKTTKVDVLVEIACEANMPDIIAELAEYVTDINVSLARHSIHAIGRIACNIEQALQRALHTLRSFLTLGIDYVSAECITTLKEILRKYPSVSEVVQDCVRAFTNIEEEPARIAYIWMLGEFGESVSQSPYLLEAEIECYDEHSPAIKSALLNSAIKLFFKRPGEMRPPLGSLLVQATQDSTNIDVHDRALLVARLLQHDVNEAKRVCEAPAVVILSQFAEVSLLELQDRLFEEFNTLSVLYGAPSDVWRKPKASDNSKNDDDDANADDINNYSAPVSHQPTNGSGHHSRATNGLDTHSGDDEQLDANVLLDSAGFEALWSSVPHETQVSGNLQRSFPATSTVTNMLKDRRLNTIAFGTVNGVTKFFLYGKLSSAEAPALVEWLVFSSTGKYSATIKAANTDVCHIFSQLFVSVLDSAF
eukprot:c8666_g1_i3.p1 GENE.c8666_g1_i3~~c8666_g1_i3.p1  ORF type:complete len:510 (+),score=147.87 c8666_g1_i3:467-1996(+)